jgi:DNA-directed RNA polymerase, sigma subunit (sigma70/sigma32)
MDIDRELFDEENSYMQIQDRWENFGTQNGIADDGYDHHSLHGAPRFEVTEKINALLNGILTTDENLILREYFGIGCQQRTIEELAEVNHSTEKAMQSYLKEILQRIREHDETLELWKYLFRS